MVLTTCTSFSRVHRDNFTLLTLIFFFSLLINSAFTQNTPAWFELSIIERLLKYDWSKELIIIASIIAFIFAHLYGASTNKKKVENWIDAHREVLKEEFFQVGFKNGKEYVSESPVNYVSFATGRLFINSLTANFTLKGRQNIISLTLEYILSFFFNVAAPTDNIDIAISINKNTPLNGFVFAIVNKEIMKRAREEKYYLSLSKTTDSPKLPVNFVFMSEATEITDNLFTPELEEAVQKAANVLNFVAFTDQRAEHPETVEDIESFPRIVLSLKFPSNEEEAKTSAAILSAAINLVEVASKQKLRPETIRKLKNVRESAVKKINKLQDEKKAEELAQKKAEEKREERNRISKLSPAEQKKHEEKERQKEQRKQRSKQMRRG